MFQRVVPVLLTLSALAPVTSACHTAPAAADPRTQAPFVRVATVQTSVRNGRSFTGVVAARVQSDLGFRVPGKILERLVDTGQSVKRGQALMRIDPADLRLATRAQEEAVVAASARAKQTSDDEARYRDLVSAGAVSASTYDKVKAVAESARAELNAANAQADVARNVTGYAVLLADADGVVMETLAEPGQVVGAGEVVVRIARAGRREAVVELPETLRPRIGSAARASLYAGGLAGPATLRQLSDAANRLTRTFEARYVLQGPLADAPLGSTIAVEIPDGDSAPTRQVPLGAIFDPGTGPGVWLVHGGETPQVAWRPVHIATLGDETASVVGQLQTGDRVVALGAHLLHQGTVVRVVERDAEARPARTEGGKR
jgi:RND family efflux transporter MFP subunit